MDDVCERAAMLREQGLSYREVAAQLGLTYNTTYRMLNPEQSAAHRRAQREAERKRRGEARVKTEDDLRARLRDVEREAAVLRGQLRQVRQDLEAAKEQQRAMNLTELHEWWLATKSPDEIVRIAQGLAEWDVAA